MAQTPGNPTANTFRIDADETALTLALARRIAGFSRARPRAANADPLSRSQVGCGGLTLSTDKPAADLIGALRDALREVGIEATTLWAGTSGVEIAATMDDARIARTATMLGTLAASPPPAPRAILPVSLSPETARERVQRCSACGWLRPIAVAACSPCGG